MALYNNGYPATYQQMYYQPQVQQNQQFPHIASNGIIWVQGEAGAKSYLVAPNTTVQLWDSENNVIYLKSADSSGLPSMRILDYTIRENASQMPQNGLKNESMYVTKEEFEKFKNEILESRKSNRLTEEDDAKLPF